METEDEQFDVDEWRAVVETRRLYKDGKPVFIEVRVQGGAPSRLRDGMTFSLEYRVKGSDMLQLPTGRA